MEFIIFVCTDSTEIFSKLRSAGLNYNLPSFFTDSYCAGGIKLALLIDFFHFFCKYNSFFQFYFSMKHVIDTTYIYIFKNYKHCTYISWLEFFSYFLVKQFWIIV